LPQLSCWTRVGGVSSDQADPRRRGVGPSFANSAWIQIRMPLPLVGGVARHCSIEATPSRSRAGALRESQGALVGCERVARRQGLRQLALHASTRPLTIPRGSRSRSFGMSTTMPTFVRIPICERFHKPDTAELRRWRISAALAVRPEYVRQN